MEEPKTLDPVVVTDSTPDAAPLPVAKQPPAMPNFQQMLIDRVNRPPIGGGGNPQQALKDTIAGKQAEANLAMENAKRKEATMRPLQEAKIARIGQTEEQQAGISKELNTPFQVPQETVADFSALGGLVGIMGVMLGTSGKMSAQNVLQSATGILDGYKKGRADLIAQKQKEFEANMKRLTALSTQIQNQLKTYMDKAAVKDQTAQLSLDAAAAEGANGIVATVVKGQSAFEIQKMNQSLASSNQAAQHYNDNILMQLAKDQEARITAQQTAARTINLAPAYQDAEGNIVQRDPVTGALPTDQGPLTRVSTPPKAGGGALPKTSAERNEYTNRVGLISNIDDIKSLLDDPKYAKLITPTTNFTPALIQNLKEGFPELSQKLARIQAIEFSIGGKSLTKPEQKILEPLYGWRGLTVEALRKRLEGTKDEFEKSTQAFETFYPGLAEIRPKLDQIYQNTGRVPSLPETGLPDVEQTAQQRFNAYEPDKYNYGFDNGRFYRELK
jgi:cytochrome c556